ncbi:MarR family transcriptional regulator [Kyrpidia spormannii]|uniref:MarR family transcriptional regulator n=1 Tax=Kyrpidia spormannii TaxID=2055160 RepID=A0ACA8ZBG8_9BACL|nr:MarR family transcriptional regulator [Kyrpidia spormannii]
MEQMGPDPAGLERFFEHLQAVNRYVRAGWFGEPRRQPTRVQWMILRKLQRTGGCSVGELAQRVDVGPSAMSQMLDRLERVGWLSREPDPRDARGRTVRLTRQGEDVVRAVEQEWIRRLARPFARLEPDEQKQLLALMDKLAQFVTEEGR